MGKRPSSAAGCTRPPTSSTSRPRACKRLVSRISGWVGTRVGAEAVFDFFAQVHGTKYEKAVACLAEDRDRSARLLRLPKHGKHVRSTNPIEGSFATVWLRTTKTKGCLASETALARFCKRLLIAAKKWRGLNGPDHLAEVIQGVRVEHGISQIQKAACITHHRLSAIAPHPMTQDVKITHK